MEQILEEYPNDVRFVFRHFPLIGTPEAPYHDKAALSAQAAEAAGKQDMFWEMHDLIFAYQSEWRALTIAQYQEWLILRAEALGLDVKTFEKDLTSQELVDMAQTAWDWGQSIGIPGTPFIMINGEMWPSSVSMSYANVAALVELTLLENRQYTACPPMVIDPAKQYIATIYTEKGNIVIELFADVAPLAVNSFVFLAQNAWFDGITFHRVIPGFVAQTGDPTNTGFGGPGYNFANEIASDLTFDRAGLVGMANAGTDTNGSQFFITYAAQPNLNGGYTIFGQVISGMDVATALTPRDPSTGKDLPAGDVILRVTITEK